MVGACALLYGRRTVPPCLRGILNTRLPFRALINGLAVENAWLTTDIVAYESFLPTARCYNGHKYVVCVKFYIIVR